MERQEGYWRRFEKTGDVMDYLNYTACTRESFPEDEEVEDDDWDAHRELDGSVGYADRGLR